MVEILKKDVIIWRKLSPEESGYELLGELKTLIKGTGKGGTVRCEEGVSSKARERQSMHGGEKRKIQLMVELGEGCRAARLYRRA